MNATGTDTLVDEDDYTVQSDQTYGFDEMESVCLDMTSVQQEEVEVYQEIRFEKEVEDEMNDQIKQIDKIIDDEDDEEDEDIEEFKRDLEDDTQVDQLL